MNGGMNGGMNVDRNGDRSGEYVDRVRAELAEPLTAAERDGLDDLADAIAEAGDEAGFGSPQEYAARLRDALAPNDNPDGPVGAQARILGIPVETRALTEPRVVARVWDPANPALFVPRLVGAGWTVNLGALAVRLGLLRPDDYDADAVAHIPPAVRAAAKAVPLAVSAATCAAIAACWHRLPERIPTSWSATGRVQRRGGRSSLLALAAIGLAPALWSASPAEPEEALVNSGVATSMAALSMLAVAMMLVDADREVGERGTGARLLPALAVVPLAGLLDIVLPVRAGLRRLWEEEVGSSRRPARARRVGCSTP